MRFTAFLALSALVGTAFATPSTRDLAVRDGPRPGEDNGDLPFKVQLKIKTTKDVAPKQETGDITTSVTGNYPPFEIIDTKSSNTWNHDQRVFGGGYIGKTKNGGADASVQLGMTNGTILAGFDGGEFGASPRIKFIYFIDGTITITIDGNGADLTCVKNGQQNVCSGSA